MFKLLKLSLCVKYNIIKCKMCAKNTEAYTLASEYQKRLDNLDKTDSAIDSFITDVNEAKQKHADNKAVSNLSNSIIKFLEHLKGV